MKNNVSNITMLITWDRKLYKKKSTLDKWRKTRNDYLNIKIMLSLRQEIILTDPYRLSHTFRVVFLSLSFNAIKNIDYLAQNVI